MKRIIMAATALTLIAAPAFARDGTSQIEIGGSVAGQCGAGNQSGGGSASTPTIALGELTDGDGFLDVSAVELGFGNMWCNTAANLTMSASALSTDVDVLDTSSFVNTLDMVVNGAVIDTYFGTPAGSSARTGEDLEGSIAHAFETGNGQYSKAMLNVELPQGTVGNDRPVAGDYTGTVTFTASVS